MRLIGDLHGYSALHLLLASAATQSIQVGDCGFNYEYLAKLNPANHKVIAGNHDNYEAMESKHWLGDYGTYQNFFFVRGAYSVDKDRRREGYNWWPQEELSFRELYSALEEYKKAKPRVVITHDCPLSVMEKLGKGRRGASRTQAALEGMLNAWVPEKWYFGHHHKSWTDGWFKCLGIGEYVDINP